MGQKRILIVDDCIDTVELLQACFEKNFETYAIQDSRRFQDALEVFEPDLITLDLMMPKVNGFQILDNLREEYGDKMPLVVVVSAKRNVEDQKKAYAKGARFYLAKPFEPSRLLRSVEMFIEEAGLTERPKRHRLSEIDRQMEMRATFSTSRLAHRRHVEEMRAQAKAEKERERLERLRHGARRPAGDDEEEEAPQPKWVD